MATTKAISANAYKNNGLTIAMGGAVGSIKGATPNTITQASMLASVTRYGNQNGTTTSYKAKAVTAGLMGRMEKNYYIIMGYTPKLYGSASTIFVNSGAMASYRKSGNYRTSVTTLKSITAGWNYGTGAYLTAPTTQTDSFGADRATETGRRPYSAGKLVFTASSPARVGPLSTQILRTSYESKNL